VAQTTTTPFSSLVRGTESIGDTPPRHISRLTSLRALHDVSNGVRLLPKPYPTAAGSSGFTIDAGCGSAIGIMPVWLARRLGLAGTEQPGADSGWSFVVLDLKSALAGRVRWASKDRDAMADRREAPSKPAMVCGITHWLLQNHEPAQRALGSCCFTLCRCPLAIPPQNHLIDDRLARTYR
jgi:hypothetical protein